MSLFNWLHGFFASSTDEGASDPGSDPVVIGQHIRVVLAILVCIISAFVLWWILT